MSHREHHPHLTRRYGSEPDQFGDLHVSHADPERGLVILVHGGFWRSRRDLTMTRPAAAALSALGWNVWNIEYQRGASISWRQTLDDVAAAVAHVPELAAEVDLDTSLTLLVGHSAGGHLAAWAAATGCAADGVVTLNGVLDLGLASELGVGTGAVEEFLHASPGALEVADPACHLPLTVPARLLHSRGDERVPFAVTQEFYDKARNAGSDVELSEITGPHTHPIDVGSDAWERVVEEISRPWPARVR